MKIVICDDEPYYLEKVKGLIEENLCREGIDDSEIRTYESGKTMCEDTTFWEWCEVLFLDINMQDRDGIEIAHDIKEKRPDIYIVFVTAELNYVFMGYRVEAFRYLLKEELEVLMRECITSLLQKMKREDYYIRCTFSSGERKVRAKDIVYIESYRHKMLFHMNVSEDEVYEMNGSLNDLEQKLVEHRFVRIHKSYLVNMDMVDFLERYQVTLQNGDTLPIPRDKYQQVRGEYFKIVGDI